MRFMRNVRVGSAWLLTAAAAMFATAVSYPTPVEAQPVSLPPICTTFAQPVVVHTEHDVPLRMVVASVLEGHDGVQASAFLNGDTCGTPAPRALNVLPGHHPGADGMSLRAMAEGRLSMFNTENVDGARFLSVADILCAPGNEHAFEAQYRLAHNVPANAEEVDADGGVPTDAGFVREEEREKLHLDCGSIRRNPTEPRHWFRESVPRHASIYIGARGRHDVVLPRGGIARPTELACRSLATLADSQTDDVALVALRSALRDPEPVDAFVRAVAITRITNIAVDLARRSHINEGNRQLTGDQVEELRLARAEVRRLRDRNSALVGDNNGLRGTIRTVIELPAWLGGGIIVLVVLFILFASWAFSSINRLVKSNRGLRADVGPAAKKAASDIAAAYERGKGDGVRGVFKLAIKYPRLKPAEDDLPVLVRESQVQIDIREATRRYDEEVIPSLEAKVNTHGELLESLSWAILSLFPEGDERRNPGFVTRPTAKELGDAAIIYFRDAIEAYVAEARRVDAATIAHLQEQLRTNPLVDFTRLVETVHAFGKFMAGKLPPDHSLREQLLNEADPINIVHAAVGLIMELRDTAEGVSETTEILRQLAANMDEAIETRAGFHRYTLALGVIMAHPKSEPPPGSMSLMDAVMRLRQRLEIVLGLLSNAGDTLPPVGMIPAKEEPPAGLVRKRQTDPGLGPSTASAPISAGEVGAVIDLTVQELDGSYRMRRPDELEGKDK